ncbi:MAG: hypothetical protein HQL37_16565, partial [Alphaproteobacteria bacterium]|nr:hypothetical protein [Alphaproteobacteria bacterium]
MGMIEPGTEDRVARITNYEIHVFHEGRWILNTILDTEGQATALAKGLLNDKKNDGVRVIKDWRRPDGSYGETTLFEQMKRVERKKDVSVADIAAAPLCNEPIALYKPDARATTNRLLRKYLDEAILTPTELLHNYSELKRVLNTENLAASAVEKVAGIQAHLTGQSSRVRRDLLFKMIDQVLQRARQAGDTSFPRVKDVGLPAVLKAVDAGAPPEDRDYCAMIALSAHLIGIRNWTGKISEVLKQSLNGGDHRLAVMADTVVADVFGASTVLQDMIGQQRNLGMYIQRLADFMDGHLALGGRESSDPAIDINQRLGTGSFPQTRAFLTDAALRYLKSAQPLARNEPGEEFEAFKKLLERFVKADEIFAGPETAEALAMRYMRFLPQGGVSGRREAVTVAADLLATTPQKVCFLVSLA